MTTIDEYKDCKAKMEEIRAKKNLSKMKEVKAGDYITYGTYEQDYDTGNGQEEIEWVVLEVKDNKVLVISRYALDYKAYNVIKKNITWETCSLRKWLNNNFIADAFTTDERNYIRETTVTADKNPKYSTYPGNNTQDKIFLLSINEVNKYFLSDIDRQCFPTEYVSSYGSYYTNDSGYCRWWLRTPGYSQDDAATVSQDGEIDEGGINYETLFVRPAMWINLEV